jgi:hypothetical protein
MSETIGATVDSCATARDQLRVLAETVQAEHIAVIHAARGMVEHAIKAGEALQAAKAQIGRGKWGGWLRKHCDLQERTAQRYMGLAGAKELLQANPTRVSDLSLRGALQLIAQKKTTQDPRQKKSTGKAALNLLAWSDATPQERTKFLDAIGYSSLIAAIPPAWGQQIKETFTGSVSDRASTALKMALSTTIEGEALAAIAALKRILAATGNDLHDIQIQVVRRKPGHQRAA